MRSTSRDVARGMVDRRSSTGPEGHAMYYTVTSDKTFQQAAADLDAAVRRNGFGVLRARPRRHAARQRAWTSARNAACSRSATRTQAAKVLAADMRLNMALPCRISVCHRGRPHAHRPDPAGADAGGAFRRRGAARGGRRGQAATIKMVDEAGRRSAPRASLRHRRVGTRAAARRGCGCRGGRSRSGRGPPARAAREKYSGVSDRRDAIVALLTGSGRRAPYPARSPRAPGRAAGNRSRAAAPECSAWASTSCTSPCRRRDTPASMRSAKRWSRSISASTAFLDTGEQQRVGERLRRTGCTAGR